MVAGFLFPSVLHCKSSFGIVPWIGIFVVQCNFTVVFPHIIHVRCGETHRRLGGWCSINFTQLDWILAALYRIVFTYWRTFQQNEVIEIIFLEQHKLPYFLFLYCNENTAFSLNYFLLLVIFYLWICLILYIWKFILSTTQFFSSYYYGISIIWFIMKH